MKSYKEATQDRLLRNRNLLFVRRAHFYCPSQSAEDGADMKRRAGEEGDGYF